MKLHVPAFGLSLGLVWGVSLFVMAILAQYGFGVNFVKAFGDIYIGYNATAVGGVVGALWGFVDLLVGGVIVAWLYNLFAGCCGK